LLDKTNLQKISFLTGRLPDPIESDPVARKKNSHRFGIRTLELTIKVQRISIFIKRVIYEEVNSMEKKRIFLVFSVLIIFKIS
jgi:hypothetical protein